MQIKRETAGGGWAGAVTNPAEDNSLLSIKGEWMENAGRMDGGREGGRKKHHSRLEKLVSKDYDNFPTTNEHENPTAKGAKELPGPCQDPGPLLAAVDKD